MHAGRQGLEGRYRKEFRCELFRIYSKMLVKIADIGYNKKCVRIH